MTKACRIIVLRLIITGLSYLFACQTIYAQDWESVFEANKNSLIFIEVKFSTKKKDIFTVKTGTGFVVSANGRVLTNKHVIEPGNSDEKIESITGSIGGQDGQKLQLLVDDTSRTEDVALLAFTNTPTNVKPVTLGDGTKISAGQSVLTLGFPNASGTNSVPSPTDGMVTNPRSTLDNVHVSVETNLMLYNGNSGGPVFNQQGEVVGIIFAKRKYSQSGEILPDRGFFISIEKARELLPPVSATATTPNEDSIPPPVIPKATPGPVVRFVNENDLDISSIPDSAFFPPGEVDSPEHLVSILKTYPTLTVLGSNFFVKGQREFDDITIYLNRLKITNSRIFLGTKTLRIVVRELDVLGSDFTTFPSSLIQTSSGADGQEPGSSGGDGPVGLSAGSLEIYVLGGKKFFQSTIDLSGSIGGAGGKGSRGIRGAAGAAGRGGSDSAFGCKRGPGNGERGQSGGAGGRGGNGGDGGNGGYAAIRFMDDAPSPRFAPIIKVDGGTGGPGGVGGSGGQGGPGGSRGSQTVFCNGGSNGPTGVIGPDGEAGLSGRLGRTGTVTIDSIGFTELNSLAGLQ